MNMDLNCLPQFKAVIEDIVKTQIKNMGITNYISAIVQKVNVDGTADVYLPPNKFNIVTKLFNKTGEQINVGDSVEIATKNGSLSNAWIAVKHGNSISDEHYKQTVSDSSLYLKYAGNHTEAASSTTPSDPNYGMLYPSGFYLTGTYNDSNTPASYGNIINMAGGGTGQLLCEWSGADNTNGHLYYRSHRDTDTGGWSSWNTILDSANYSSYALPLSGGTMTGNISYRASGSTYSMIRFITGDQYGHGISIGGGGLTVIGGGESADTVVSGTGASGDSEAMYICNDGNIDFYTNCQSGYSSSKHSYINTDGDFYSAGSVRATAGYLYTILNGKTTQIGSQNSSYCHYTTDAPYGHWFNTDIRVQGALYKGSSYNQNVPAVFVQSGIPTATQIGDIWFVT